MKEALEEIVRQFISERGLEVIDGHLVRKENPTFKEFVDWLL